MTTLAPISRGRRRTDLLARGLLVAGTLVALVPLLLILFYLLKRGLGSWSLHFFTTDPTGRFFGDAGGIKSAILGTIEIVALALLMLPIVIRSAEVVLELVPSSLREAGLALGAPRWQVIGRVVLPTALPGIVTGVLLSIARVAGETAPLLFTATIVKATTYDLGGPMNSLPAQIFSDVGQAQDRLVTRAWGAALALVVMILLFTTLARLLARRSALR